MVEPHNIQYCILLFLANIYTFYIQNIPFNFFQLLVPTQNPLVRNTGKLNLKDLNTI